MSSRIAELAIAIRADGIQPATKALTDVDSAGKKAAQSLSSAFTAVKGLLVGGAVAGAISTLVTATREFERSQTVLVGASKLTGVALGNLQGVAGALRKEFALSAPIASDLTATVARLANSAQMTGSLDKLTRSLLDLTAATGGSPGDAATIAQQIMSGQDEGLNRLGLPNPSQIYKAAGAVTDLQKQQALVNAVMREAARVQGAYNDRMNTAPGQIDRARAAVEDLKTSLAEGLAPTLAGAAQGAADLVEWVGENGALVSGMVAAATTAYGLTKAVQGFNAAIAAGTASAGMRALLSPAGLAIASAALAAGTVVWASGKESERRNAAADRGRAMAAGARPEQIPGMLATSRRDRELLIAAINGEDPATAENPQAREAINRRRAVLTEELQRVEALIAAYEERNRLFAGGKPGAGGGGGGSGKGKRSKYRADPNLRALSDDAINAQAGRDADPLTILRRMNAPGPTDMAGAVSDAISTMGDVAAMGQAMEDAVRAEMQGRQAAFAEAVGASLVGGFGDGIQRAIASGSISEGFKALAGTLVGGLGSALRQFGEAGLMSSTLMAKLQSALAGLNPAAGIAISLGMIALGATLQGAAQKSFGGMGRSTFASTGVPAVGGGGGGISGGGIGLPEIIDRGVIGGAVNPNFGGAAPAIRPVVVNATIVGAGDHRAQRDFVELLRNARERGLEV